MRAEGEDEVVEISPSPTLCTHLTNFSLDRSFPPYKLFGGSFTKLSRSKTRQQMVVIEQLMLHFLLMRAASSLGKHEEDERGYNRRWGVREECPLRTPSSLL
jgi:hypothetical protein